MTSLALYTATHSDDLRQIEDTLDHLLGDLPSDGQASVLPKATHLPPHILNKTETQSVLPRAKDSKSSRKRKKEVDPYGGGEQPGKLAKKDAKGKAAAVAVATQRQPLSVVPNGR